MREGLPEVETVSRWQQLSELLTSGGSKSAVQRSYPADPSLSLSLLDALTADQLAVDSVQRQRGQGMHRKLRGLLDQLRAFGRVSHCPVVAITGLLNAGKSTLLATYLSHEGRARVLRGVGNQQGTHRFVIWLPRVWWSEPQLLNGLVELIVQIFGQPPEQLSDDPSEALDQYNGRILTKALVSVGDAQPPSGDSAVDPLTVPLLASDSGLDKLRLGLIDCPDIQTGFLTATNHTVLQGQELAAHRREALARIGRLCSAFVVVSKLSSLHDDALLQLLTTLRDAMPGVPRLLAINKVKARYSPEVVAQEARRLTDRFGVSATFAAYDYRSAVAGERMPPPPPGLVSSVEQPQPIYFAVDGGVSPQVEYLYELSNRLDAGHLARESLRSLTLQLQVTASESSEWINHNLTARVHQVSEAWKAIAQACYDFMAERDSAGAATGLRLQASPKIIAQLVDSLQRTAPGWMRLSLSIDRTARNMQQAISNQISRFKIFQSVGNGVSQLAQRFRRGEGAQVVTPQKLAEAICRYDVGDALADLSQSRLEAGCEFAMKRFAAEDQSQLDATELDAWSREIWAQMSLKQKLWRGAQPLAVIMGPLLAAVLVPFDGGGTAVLVFASVKELVAAAGIAALMAPTVTGREALKIVHQETPWRQLSDLFALVCDGLGVARPPDSQLPYASCGNERRQLLASTLSQSPPVAGDQGLSQWQWREGYLKSLQVGIQSCL